MSKSKWIYKNLKNPEFNLLAEKFGVHPAIIKILADRGVQGEDAVREYLEADIATVSNGSELTDMQRGVNIVYDAVQAGKYMWFFLKGCIPTERTNAIFVMLSNISPDFVNDNGDIVVPGIPACAMLVDLVYVKSEEELIGLGMPAKYLEGMQIIKDSLEQYTTECYITEKYDEMTDGQKQLLKNINETEACLLTLRQPKDGIAAVFHFVGCGKDIKQKVWLADSTL